MYANPSCDLIVCDDHRVQMSPGFRGHSSRSQVHSVIAIGKNIATQVLCSIPEKTWRIGIINSEQLKTEDDMI